MADVKNVLVFPAGTEISFEIRSALSTSKFVKLYGATSVPCHAEFVYENCAEGVPYVDDPGFVDAINAIVDRWGIDYIYPAHDSALLTLTREQARLHAAVVTSPLETVEICRSKNRTYQFLAGASYLPRVYASPDEVDHYPVFVKPSVGQGSEGARLVHDRTELDAALAEGRELAICEYLPGRELTVDCFTDRHGELRFVSPRSRDRIKAGISVRSRLLPQDAASEAVARDLNRRLRFNGAWFFQLKENARGEVRLLEVAPRIAGTMGLVRNQGVNMPLLTLYNMWDSDVSILTNGRNLMLDRCFISRFQSDIEYDRVYVDFDDTLVRDGKVNPMLIAFLYQARGKGKSLFLLTKHRGDHMAELEKQCIAPNLFDEIIHMEKGENKARCISGRAVFIDDSFAERRQVREVCGIPVFDLDMVESLLDWRV